jgi:hypothetical protein
MKKCKFLNGAVGFIWEGTYPLPVPPPGQKGYQSAPFSNRHPSAYSSRPETEVLQSYGARTEIQTPMHT